MVTEITTITSALPKEFLYPALLWLAVPAVFLLLWLARTSFVKEDSRFDDAKSIKRRSKLRWTVFILRTLAVLCLIMVIATPLIYTTTIRPGDIHLTVLVDESTSMDLMDTSFMPGMLEELRKTLPVTVRNLAEGETSALGESLLTNLKPGENILLVTDGYNTRGQDLSSVLGFAAQANSTVSALRLNSKLEDAAVVVEAPLKAIADTNATFLVKITSTDDAALTVKITVDDNVVYEERTTNRVIPITRTYQSGKHRITATITESDSNAQNNRYDAILSVVDKPAILVVTQKNSALTELLKQLYSVTVVASLPRNEQDLDPYYAIVFIDMPASALSPNYQLLSDYLYKGNGLLVVGGPASYDYGNYRGSAVESLLPVTVGAASAQKGITNIVLSLDMSSALEGSYVRQPDGTLRYERTDRPALVRSLGISMLEDIDPNHNVGAVVIGSSSDNASLNLVDDELIMWDYIGGQNLGRVSPFGSKRTALIDSISTIRGGGQAASQYWLAAPLRALEGVSGSKNIIVITDGMSCKVNCLAAKGGSDEAQTINIAATIAAQGGKVYIIGVVPGINDAFLTEVAAAGNGIYFKASEQNKLKILFGDPNDKKDDEDAFGLVVLNSNHFITRDVNIVATMYGYNQVIPKQYSSLLVTSQSGQPVLTVWNYGVGRVGSFTAFNGDGYGEITATGNSLLVSRTGNWLVGDPERKQDSVVLVPQLRIGETGYIRVTSTRIPTSDALNFVPRGNNVYEAEFTPSATGFGTVGGIPYASSYPAEYEGVGMNPELESLLQIADGRVFEPQDTSAIIEHVRTVRELQETRNRPLRSPFLLAAAILFLLEIALRRGFDFARARDHR